MILHVNEDARSHIFDEIDQIFNEGKPIDSASQEAKLMILSKTRDADPTAD
jgi:hypothetical protein